MISRTRRGRLRTVSAAGDVGVVIIYLGGAILPAAMPADRIRWAMTAILGISAFYHDSAAALVIDGRIVAAAQEERFTRIKHDHNFPTHAIDYCLAEAKLQPQD